MSDFERGDPDPIFLLGILPRSGTNFLFDLLCLHPDCGPGRVPINEDLFLDKSDHLVAFIRSVRKWWDPMWGDISDELMRDFHTSLGDGLISFLWMDRTRRLVTKSPSVHNVDRFFMFYPRARLLILVRDGRSVVQSCMETFGWHFERAARSWSQAAEEIRRFHTSGVAPQDRYRIVRYEDLLDDLGATLSSLLEFLVLDRTVYDFEAAGRLPVRGSSFYFGPGRSSVHWDPVEKTQQFDSKERWHGWTPAMHERFEWIAGDHMRYFGYQGLPRPIRGRAILKHRLGDLNWRARTGTKVMAYRARGRVGAATRPLRKRLGLLRTEP